MAVKIGINGFGRIGRLVYRASLAKGSKEQTSKEKIKELQDMAREEEKIAKEFQSLAKEQESLAKEAQKKTQSSEIESKNPEKQSVFKELENKTLEKQKIKTVLAVIAFFLLVLAVSGPQLGAVCCAA